MRRFVAIVILLCRCQAQRTRFTFRRFELRFPDETVLSCGDGPWDGTAEAIRSGAEECLRTVHCDAFQGSTPFFVGLGNVQCEDESVTFVGGGAMDFNDAVPLDPAIVEECVRDVLQSDACVPIFASYYDERIAAPAMFVSWRYPDLVPKEETSTSSHDTGKLSNHTSAEGMEVPIVGIASACTTVAVFGGCLLAVLLHRRRRRRRNTSKSAKVISTTAIDMTHDDSDVERGLSRSDSLGTKDSRKSVLEHMLEHHSMASREDDHTPTTIKELDASFESTFEEFDGEAIEVGLEETRDGPYDTRPVAEASLSDDVAPVILVPTEATTPFEDTNNARQLQTTQLQSFQLAPFVESSYDESSLAIRAIQQKPTNNYDAPPRTNHSSRALFDLPPQLGHLSDDHSNSSGSNDSLLVDLESENEGMVELLSDGCASTTLMDSDHEFEPDAYWDPDDNSISTADAAGLVATGTGEYSFEPTKHDDVATEDGIKEKTLQTPDVPKPPRSLYNWLCDAPTICTSSAASLPSLLGTKRPTTVHQRTKSFGGTPPHQ